MARRRFHHSQRQPADRQNHIHQTGRPLQILDALSVSLLVGELEVLESFLLAAIELFGTIFCN